MGITDNVKENIIQVTTELIEQNNGNTKNITARIIAEKSGVGLGLINYHFGSKDNLISICVQRIIEKVIDNFDVKKEYATDKERITASATYVFEFLFEHNAISRLSILSDLENYIADCNSVHTQRGFMRSLKENKDFSDKAFISFILTAAMQIAFLGGETVKELLGYDFSNHNDRAAYIERLVSVLFNS